MLATGARLGAYEIVGLLGSGGMGEVYRARDSRLNREVALKVLPQTVSASPIATERFRREAQLLASLNHPRIATVYGFEDGALAMELVPGPTLAERLQPGAMPPEEARGIALQLADALEYAHEHGIIHRDLKPANIKLTADDQVKVLDFGLARVLQSDPSGDQFGDARTLSTPATLPGTILGTAAYMAPEQARGKAVDRRADIWAFGAVWFEMLTGQKAFTGDSTSDVLAAVLRAEPDWERLPANLPAAQRRLLQRCLRKDPRQRQQSVGDLRLALEENAENVENAAGPGPAAAAPTKWRWLPRAGFGLAGLILGAGAVWALLPPASAPRATQYRAITSMAGVQMEPALSPDERSVAFVSDRDGGFNVYVSLIGGGSLLQLTTGSQVKSHPAWSPNGNLLTYAQLNASGLWDVWELPALGGTPRLLLRDASDATWSPDGKWLAYGRPSSGGLWVSTPSGDDATQLASESGYQASDPRFSPDGSEIAFVAKAPGPYGRLQVVTRSTKAVRQLTLPEIMVLSPAWSPDGRSLYFASGLNGAINVWKMPAAGGSPTQVTSGQGDDAELDISQDARRLCFATFRTDSHVMHLELTSPIKGFASTSLTTDPARNQLAPQYSPDGKRIAYFTNLKGVELEQVWTANADGAQAVPLVSDSLRNIFPRWAPDGGRVFFATEPPFGQEPLQTRAVAADGGPAQSILLRQTDHNFDVGPGNRLLLVNARGGIEQYDPATQQQRVLWPGSPALRPVRARWSPQGDAFAFSVAAQRDGDANAGLWVREGQSPPRQIFRGWVRDFERGPKGLIYIRAGSPDMQDTLWTVDWSGRGLTRLSAILPMPHDYWSDMGRDLFAVSPDGRAIAFAVDDDLHANIGILTFGR